jgi:hypothetical protein
LDYVRRSYRPDEANFFMDDTPLFDRDIARKMILKQPNLQALLRNNHHEPYIQVDIVPFYKKT